MKLSTTIALSLLCLTLAPLGARADEQSDQQACMGDAMTICGQFIPDRERVGACLLFQPQPHLAGLPHRDAALPSEDGVGALKAAQSLIRRKSFRRRRA